MRPLSPFDRCVLRGFARLLAAASIVCGAPCR